MKVLDVTEFYSERGGGVRSHLSLKQHELCQRGHEHVVVAPGSTAREESALAHLVGHARVIRVAGPAMPYDPTYHFLVRVDKIHAIIKAERPDVLEIHSPYVAALAALTAPKKSYRVRTFQWHSDFIDTYAGTLKAHLDGRRGAGLAGLGLGGAGRSLWGMVRFIARRCAATLVASRWQRDKLRGHGVPRVVHVPFGLEKAVFGAARPDPALRAELMAGRDGALLVGVGRFAVEKRWEVLLRGFFRWKASGGRGRLVLCGDGPERARMTALIDGRDDVVLRGFVKDRPELARVLATADALVHACPFETFGLSVAEAIASGAPAVLPDEGGAAELGDPAYTETYRSGDDAALAAAIARLLARGPGLHDAAREAGRAMPSVGDQFERQLALYEALLRGETIHE